MRKISQFRFYKESNANNNPSAATTGLLRDAWSSPTGGIFPTNIVSLGIQTIPGVQFILDNNYNHPISVGHTGIYELELNDSIFISNLYFTAESIYQIDTNENAYLIVDCIYEEEDV